MHYLLYQNTNHSTLLLYNEKRYSITTSSDNINTHKVSLLYSIYSLTPFVMYVGCTVHGALIIMLYYSEILCTLFVSLKFK